MNDEEKCSQTAKLFYQHISDQVKKNPSFTIKDMPAFAYDWAMMFGFDHPRCFVNYINNLDSGKQIDETQSQQSR